MIETTQAPPAPTVEKKDILAPTNHAVKICIKAYERAHRAATGLGDCKPTASRQAEMAFRMAMPQLTGPGDIHEYIPCVAYGMLIKVIEGPEGARLLYAAQVANSTFRSQRPPTPRGSLSPLVRQYYGLSD